MGEIKKVKCPTYLFFLKKVCVGQKGKLRELYASPQHLGDYGANPLRSHIQAHEGQDDERKQPAQIHEEKPVTSWRNCVL